MRLLTLSMLIGLLQFTPQWVSGHSWLECVDYQDGFADITSNNYDMTKCKGFTRGWNKLGSGVQFEFGTALAEPDALAHSRYTIPDMVLTEPATMFDSADTYTCRFMKDEAGNYNSQFPSPTYTPGQKIRIIWPGVNHGGPATTCPSPALDQIDTLHIVCDGDAVDTTQSFGDITIRQMLDGESLANDLKQTSTTTVKYGTTISTGLGFKNCPAHCDDTAKAVCFSDLTLPADLPIGKCSFYWLWEFNDRDYYTSCWEADIVAGDNVAPPEVPAPTPAPAPRCRRWWCQAGVMGGAAGGTVVVGGAVAGFLIYRRKKRTQQPAHIGLTNEDSNARFL